MHFGGYNSWNIEQAIVDNTELSMNNSITLATNGGNYEYNPLKPLKISATSEYSKFYSASNLTNTTSTNNLSWRSWFSNKKPSKEEPQEIFYEYESNVITNRLRFFYCDNFQSRQPKNYSIWYSIDNIEWLPVLNLTNGFEENNGEIIEQSFDSDGNPSKIENNVVLGNNNNAYGSGDPLWISHCFDLVEARYFKISITESGGGETYISDDVFSEFVGISKLFFYSNSTGVSGIRRYSDTGSYTSPVILTTRVLNIKYDYKTPKNTEVLLFYRTCKDYQNISEKDWIEVKKNSSAILVDLSSTEYPDWKFQYKLILNTLDNRISPEVNSISVKTSERLTLSSAINLQSILSVDKKLTKSTSKILKTITKNPELLSRVFKANGAAVQKEETLKNEEITKKQNKKVKELNIKKELKIEKIDYKKTTKIKKIMFEKVSKNINIEKENIAKINSIFNQEENKNIRINKNKEEKIINTYSNSEVNNISVQENEISMLKNVLSDYLISLNRVRKNTNNNVLKIENNTYKNIIHLNSNKYKEIMNLTKNIDSNLMNLTKNIYKKTINLSKNKELTLIDMVAVNKYFLKDLSGSEAAPVKEMSKSLSQDSVQKKQSEVVFKLEQKNNETKMNISNLKKINKQFQIGLIKNFYNLNINSNKKHIYNLLESMKADLSSSIEQMQNGDEFQLRVSQNSGFFEPGKIKIKNGLLSIDAKKYEGVFRPDLSDAIEEIFRPQSIDKVQGVFNTNSLEYSRGSFSPSSVDLMNNTFSFNAKNKQNEVSLNLSRAVEDYLVKRSKIIKTKSFNASTKLINKSFYIKPKLDEYIPDPYVDITKTLAVQGYTRELESPSRSEGGLEVTLRYPYLPETWDGISHIGLLIQHDRTDVKTFQDNVSVVWEPIKQDVVITEKWSGMDYNFFYQLWLFYSMQKRCKYRPKDLNNHQYLVEIIGIDKGEQNRFWVKDITLKMKVLAQIENWGSEENITNIPDLLPKSIPPYPDNLV